MRLSEHGEEEEETWGGAAGVSVGSVEALID